jgi:hypothetical protein
MSGDAPDLPARFHAAARRYCIERHDAWTATYEEMQRVGAGYNPTSGTYSLRARAVFPRYLQLHAMRVELERFEPDAFGSLAEARAALIAACERAEIPNPAVRADPIAATAIDEETALLVAHLAALDDDVLWREPPLYYRRVLAPDELDRLTARFTATFGTWYGGVCGHRPAFAYRTYDLPLDPVPAAVLRPLLPPRVFEWNELDESVEQDVSEIDFDGTEACWFAADVAWMVYASHESTLTVAGDALVREVELGAPAWSARAGAGDRR